MERDNEVTHHTLVNYLIWMASSESRRPSEEAGEDLDRTNGRYAGKGRQVLSLVEAGKLKGM